MIWMRRHFNLIGAFSAWLGAAGLSVAFALVFFAPIPQPISALAYKPSGPIPQIKGETFRVQGPARAADNAERIILGYETREIKTFLPRETVKLFEDLRALKAPANPMSPADVGQRPTPLVAQRMLRDRDRALYGYQQKLEYTASRLIASFENAVSTIEFELGRRESALEFKDRHLQSTIELFNQGAEHFNRMLKQSRHEDDRFTLSVIVASISAAFLALSAISTAANVYFTHYHKFREEAPMQPSLEPLVSVAQQQSSQELTEPTGTGERNNHLPTERHTTM